MKKIKIFGLIFIAVLTVCCLMGCSTQYTITAQANNSAYGTVTGGGSFSEGNVCVLTATGKGDYVFSEWSDGSTKNPRNIVVRSDLSLVAYFVDKDCTIVAVPNNASYGNVEGVGEYEFGDTCTLTATANAGYHFVKWSDGNTDNPREIDVRKSMSLIANFEEGECHTFSNGRQIIVKNGTFSYESDTYVMIKSLSGADFGYWKNVQTGEFYSDSEVETIYRSNLTSNLTLIAIDSGCGFCFAITDDKDTMAYNFNQQRTFIDVQEMDWKSIAFRCAGASVGVTSSGSNEFTVKLRGDYSDWIFIIRVYMYNGDYYATNDSIVGAMMSSATIGGVKYIFNRT